MAAESPAPVVSSRLELSLPDNCGSRELFLERLRLRTERISFDAPDSSLVLRATAERQESGLVSATITLARAGSPEATRTIEAGNCQEALDAMALLAAVALDPAFAARPAAESEAPPAPVPSATKTDSESRRAAPPPAPAEDVPVPSPPVSYISLAVLPTLLRGPAPSWMGGGAIEIAWARAAASRLRPELRLAVEYVTRRGVGARGGVADFSLATGTGALCPHRLATRRLELLGCGLLSAGALSSTGRGTLEPESHLRPWFAVGASLELDLVIARQWAVPLRGALLFPLVRDSYEFAPSTFYRTPATVFGLAAGVQTRFW